MRCARDLPKHVNPSNIAHTGGCHIEADALLSMCKTSFWSIFAHMGAAILEIGPEIMTFLQL